MPVRVRPPAPNIGVEASMVMQWTVNPPPLARLVRSQDTPPNKGTVMTQHDTLNKAYGNIPKEVSYGNDLFSWLPSPRGIKYYWIKLVRAVTR